MQRVTGHSLHLSLKFARSDWPPPSLCDKLRFAQIIFDLLFELRLRHDGAERRFGLRIFLRPDAMTPIDFFNRSLISDAISESQRCALLRRLCGRGEVSQPR